MKTYYKILSKRSDMTEWLIHFTRNKENGKEAKQVLRDIILEGVLRPSFSKRLRGQERTLGNTVYGLEPAVCFSEQPISFFISSLKARVNPRQMAEYGLLIHKQAIFRAGGFPVIYGIENAQELRIGDQGYEPGYRIIDLDTLPMSLQYRYVVFNPDPNSPYGNSIIDWSHEREWRWKSNKRDEAAKPYPWKPLEIFNVSAFGPNYSYINPICIFVNNNADIEWMQNEIITGLLVKLEDDIWINEEYTHNFLIGLVKTSIIALESLDECFRFEEVEAHQKLFLIKNEDVLKLPRWCHKERKIN